MKTAAGSRSQHQAPETPLATFFPEALVWERPVQKRIIGLEVRREASEVEEGHREAEKDGEGRDASGAETRFSLVGLCCLRQKPRFRV